MIIGEVHCPVTAKSGSGDVMVKSVQHSASRPIRRQETSPWPRPPARWTCAPRRARLTIGVADQLPAWLDLNSVSGDIRIALTSISEPRPGEPYVSVRGRTASGDIAVYRA